MRCDILMTRLHITYFSAIWVEVYTWYFWNNLPSFRLPSLWICFWVFNVETLFCDRHLLQIPYEVNRISYIMFLYINEDDTNEFLKVRVKLKMMNFLVDMWLQERKKMFTKLLKLCGRAAVGASVRLPTYGAPTKNTKWTGRPFALTSWYSSKKNQTCSDISSYKTKRGLFSITRN